MSDDIGLAGAVAPAAAGVGTIQISVYSNEELPEDLSFTIESEDGSYSDTITIDDEFEGYGGGSDYLYTYENDRILIGDYTITEDIESASIDGMELDVASKPEGSAPNIAAVTVAVGETSEVTFTNTYSGNGGTTPDTINVEIMKETSGADTPEDTEFTVTMIEDKDGNPVNNGDGKVVETFTYSDMLSSVALDPDPSDGPAGDADGTEVRWYGLTLDPGTYNIEENVDTAQVAGMDLAVTITTDHPNTGEAGSAPESITVTITNTYTPSTPTGPDDPNDPGNPDDPGGDNPGTPVNPGGGDNGTGETPSGGGSAGTYSAADASGAASTSTPPAASAAATPATVAPLASQSGVSSPGVVAAKQSVGTAITSSIFSGNQAGSGSAVDTAVAATCSAVDLGILVIFGFAVAPLLSQLKWIKAKRLEALGHHRVR